MVNTMVIVLRLVFILALATSLLLACSDQSDQSGQSLQIASVEKLGLLIWGRVRAQEV